MTCSIVQGNVFDLLPTIKADSVDCAVTSPPYWMLRSYLPKGHALKHLELGSEKTPAEFIGNMVRVFRLVRECLAEHGTVWLNIGDSYSSGHSGQSGLADLGKRMRGGGHSDAIAKNGRPPADGIDAGNLCLIPQRLAIALQDDGWLVRSVIVWHKPAPMPASVMGWHWRRCRVKVKDSTIPWRESDVSTYRPPMPLDGAGHRNKNAGDVSIWSDCPGCPKCEKTGGYVLRRGSWRPTSSWEPILMLAKGSGYFCDGEACKQPCKTDPSNGWLKVGASKTFSDDEIGNHNGSDGSTLGTVSGSANLRDVWKTKLENMSKEELIDIVRSMEGDSLQDVFTIAAEPLKEKHYAAFPSELVYRCLAAGTSSKGYCPTCGKPWCRVLETKFYGSAVNHKDDAEVGKHEWRGTDGVDYEPAKTIGWRQTCKCPEQPPRPGLVLDPFSGSGRTAIQAGRLGLDFVGCELNPEYCEMSRSIIQQENPLFA